MKPAEVPYLRDLTVEAYRGADQWLASQTPSREVTETLVALRARLAALEKATLSFVSGGLIHMAQKTVGSLPEWSPDGVLPQEPSLVAFRNPLTSIESIDEEGHPFRATVDGVLCWREPEGYVAVAMSRTRPSGFPPGRELVAVGVVQQAAGGLQAPPVADAQLPNPRDDLDRLAHLLGALFLLLSQPSATETTSQSVPQRRPGGSGSAQPRLVAVSYRALSSAMAPRSRGSGKAATTRWWVRGHWRQQRWGPGGRLRKPIYILPHTAGARNVPVSTRPQVQVHQS